MKNLLTILALLLVSLVSAGDFPQAGSVFDLSYLPHYPGPWRNNFGKIVDGDDKEVSAPGTNITDMACFPETDSLASSYAIRLNRMGIRLVRLHHIDYILARDFTANKAKIDRLIYYLKKYQIPVMIDGFSQRTPTDWMKEGMYNLDSNVQLNWKGYVRNLLTAPSRTGLKPWKDEPYIVGICPVNEDVYWDGVQKEQYVKALNWEISFLREVGFKGFIWGANAGIPRGWGEIPGDLEDVHEYWDHPFDVYKNTSGLVHRLFGYEIQTTKPFICTEFGSLWPGNKRSETETSFAAMMKARNAQVVLSYAYATNENGWKTGAMPIEQFQYHSDPVRISTNRILAILMSKARGTEIWDKPNQAYRYQTDGLIQVNGGYEWGNLGIYKRAPLAIMWLDPNRALIYRGIDAQNSGFESTRDGDEFSFRISQTGGLPVNEFADESQILWWSGRSPVAIWSLDTFTGKKLNRMPFYWLGDAVQVQTKGMWTLVEF